MPRKMQPSFTGGEISPALHSRVDFQRYHSSVALAKNWFIHAHGGISNRAGFEFIGVCPDHDRKTRLIEFEFNTEQTYILVFGHQKMQVIKDGGLVLEPSVAVAGATQANPVVITTGVSHGYTTGDQVYLAGIVGMAEINGKYYTITVTGATTYQLNGIDGTSFGAYASGGTSSKLFEIAMPYLEDDLFGITYTQSADVLTITHPNYEQRTLSRTDHHVWTLATTSFAASIAPPAAGLTVTQVGTASGSNNKEYRYVVTSVAATDGSESIASAIVSSGSINALSETYGNTISWTTVAGAQYYNVYKERSLNSGVFGFIGEAEEDGTPSYDDYNIGPDMAQTPPIANNPFAGTGDYPGCATYHKQRLWFGGTNNSPQTAWGTKIAQYNNMDSSRPTRDDDAIEQPIDSQKVNRIRHLLSMGELMAFTSGGTWLIKGDQDGALTPASAFPERQGGHGISAVRPLLVGNTALYVQAQGTRVRDLQYTFESDKFGGSDLSILAEHLFYGYTITDWCYAEEPFGTIVAVRSDGVLLSLTYLKEHDVWGWTQCHTDGLFEAVGCIREGNEDIIYAVVQRQVNGNVVRYVERMKERRFTDIRRAFFVDSGLSYEGAYAAIEGISQASPPVVTATSHPFSDGDVIWVRDVVGMTEVNDLQFVVANATANTFELNGMLGYSVDSSSYTAYAGGGTAQATTNTLSSLDHLEGETVVALADGNVVESLTVTNGQVSLPDYAGIIHIGLPYNCDIETLDIDFPGGETIQSKKKSIPTVTLKVRDTRGLRIGPNENRLYEFKERTVADGYSGITATTGGQNIEIATNWSVGGRMFIRQSYPLPATILAVIPEVEISG